MVTPAETTSCRQRPNWTADILSAQRRRRASISSSASAVTFTDQRSWVNDQDPKPGTSGELLGEGSTNATGTTNYTAAGLSAAGNYVFMGTATDTANGLSTTSDVSVTVNQKLTDLQLAFGSPVVGTSGTIQFGDTELDQFGNSMNDPVTWSVVSGGGTIDVSGLYTAPSTTGDATIQVTADGVTKDAPITIAAGQTTINFDNLPAWTVVTTQYPGETAIWLKRHCWSHSYRTPDEVVPCVGSRWLASGCPRRYNPTRCFSLPDQPPPRHKRDVSGGCPPGRGM